MTGELETIRSEDRRNAHSEDAPDLAQSFYRLSQPGEDGQPSAQYAKILQIRRTLGEYSG